MSKNFLATLQQEKSAIVSLEENFRGETVLRCSPENYLELINYLRDNQESPFDLFVDLAGMDNLPASPRFAVIVHLFSTKTNQTVRVKVKLNDQDPTLSTICQIYRGANWAEREAYDNYGIKFSGHPDLRRILNSYDIDFYPQRKDFPLKHYRD